MSLDGFVTHPVDGVEHLFGWYEDGDVETRTPGAGGPDAFRTSAASAGYLREMMASLGAIVSGRRLFDVAGGWGGSHPLGVPVVVVSHSVPDGWPRDGAPFTFVDDVATAVEQASAIADDGIVGVGGANVAQQCLDLGLLDEVRVNLVPVMLGEGVRFFEHFARTPIFFETPRVIEGDGVTHLSYRYAR